MGHRGWAWPFHFVGSPICFVAGVLSLPMGRTVVDRTGLDGLYDLDVTFAPEAPGAPPSDAPSLFTALQEQLGLKLDYEKELVEVLVVDRIERPSQTDRTRPSQVKLGSFIACS